MLNTSAAYKAMVYSQEYARHFIPEILLQVIDTNAREQARYSATSAAFYASFAQLTDEILKGAFDYGTLEDGFFLLNGTKRVMPSRTGLRARQYGWCSERMTNGNGEFSPAETLVCNYEVPITTAGRVFYFDANIDSVPKDFDIEYYRKGTLITSLAIRDNESYIVNTTIGTQNYDRLILRIYSTTKPYRRVHVVEDIPGLYLSFDDTNTVSISLNQIVDLFSNEIVAGEVVFEVENSEKTLNILNDEGFEKYLQRRQPVDLNLNMVFPDGYIEKVPLGTAKLSEWKVPKGGLNATFTARDAIDSLALDEYIKGVFRATPMSMYELAEEVLKDAGIKSYTIDIQLRNIYTTAPLPIASHKELLRLIAQASQSVVLPQLDGGLRIKYVSPLISATNVVSNPSFDNDWTAWSVHTDCAFSQTYIYAGKQSVSVGTGGVLQQAIPNLYKGHQYYVRFYANIETPVTGSGAYLYVDGGIVSADLTEANLHEAEWDPFSAIVTSSSTTLTIAFKNNASAILVDGFQVIDLTATYGTGKEPTKAWCDDNIRFFKTVLLIPRAQNPNPVDTFDYSILLDSPEIATSLPTRSVEANIYAYRTAAEKSEVYKGGRFISGTETFDIKFNGPAKECEVTVQSLDSSGNPTEENTAKLLSSTVYAQAATLKVQANCEVQIIVNGKAVTLETSQFKVDPDLDASLLPDAKAETIDNKLVTNKTLAEDLVSYALYWYKRRYNYDFDWRQNPAIEVLDTVVVFDDFGKNNGVLMTERTLDYQDGTLGGNSKGVC